MSRRVIGRIVQTEDGPRYVDMEALAAEPLPIRGPRTGPERGDYFSGARPSQLSTLSDRALYSVYNRLYETLAEGRGTKEEIANARDAADTIARHVRGRRVTIHG